VAEQKVDAFRALYLRNREGKPGLWTRNGYPIEGVGHILHQLAAMERIAGEPLMIDGEFCVGDGPDTLATTKAWCERDWKQGGGTRFQWFNQAAFALPALGNFGNLGRNIVRGPGTNNWDASLQKNFKVNESL
jgi:hypothetical protein